jgi:hypothetical protein
MLYISMQVTWLASVLYHTDWVAFIASTVFTRLNHSNRLLRSIYPLVCQFFTWIIITYNCYCSFLSAVQLCLLEGINYEICHNINFNYGFELTQLSFIKLNMYLSVFCLWFHRFANLICDLVFESACSV